MQSENQRTDERYSIESMPIAESRAAFYGLCLLIASLFYCFAGTTLLTVPKFF